MARSIYTFPLVVSLLAWPLFSVAQAPTELIRSSQYIFEGTVQAVHTSNVQLLPSSDQTILVRVDSMLRAPQGMVFSGKDVTIAWPSPPQLKAGERAVFFTNGWLYGQNIAMRGVGELATRDSAGLRANIIAVDAQTSDEALLARLRQSDLVIQGLVLRTAVEREEDSRRSEHETGWVAAAVKVETIFKGRAASGTKTVKVFFPSSTDELWYLSPKFSKGQEGIFILSSPVAKKNGLEGYTALNPLDFRPAQERARVEKLVRALR